MKKAQLKRKLKSLIAFAYRARLKNYDFSIISNNCWSGVTYDKYALPYLTPTIGLWIPPKDYVKFCKNLRFYLEQKLTKINYKESHVADMLIERKKSGRYNFNLDDLIIGRLYDIDIIFIHYHDFEEAKTKWNRRKNRINYNNLIFKFNDQNGCTENDKDDFLNLDYKNKLFFTAKKEWCTSNECILIKKYIKDGYVVNDTTHGDVPLNTTDYLNSLIQ